MFKKINLSFAILITISYLVGYVLLFFIESKIIIWLYFALGVLSTGWFIFNDRFTLVKTLLFNLFILSSVYSLMFSKAFAKNDSHEASKGIEWFFNESPISLIFTISLWVSILSIVISLIFFRDKLKGRIYAKSDLYGLVGLISLFVTAMLIPEMLIYIFRDVKHLVVSKDISYIVTAVIWTLLAPTFGIGSLYIGFVFKNKVSHKLEKNHFK